MYKDLDPEEMARLYELYGRAEDEKVQMLMDRFAPSEGQLKCQMLMTAEPKCVVQGQMLPLALIDVQLEYRVEKGIVVIGDITRQARSAEKARVGVHAAREFYTSGSHVPVGGQYVFRKMSPTQSLAPLPPSRRDSRVTGQMKILVDVALSLPHLRKQDIVYVVGSANTTGTEAAESYRLLEGCVAEIHLVDPKQPAFKQKRQGTLVQGYTRAQTEIVVADVLFNDAAEMQEKGDMRVLRNVVLPFEARYFSLKCAGSSTEQARVMSEYKKQGKKYHWYVQLSDTFEMRLVSEPRYVGYYHQRLGDCPACVEIDYQLPSNYVLSEHQYEVIRDMHAYGQVQCQMTSVTRPVGMVIVNTFLMRVLNAPVFLTADLMKTNYEENGQPYCVEKRDAIVTSSQLYSSSIDIGAERYYFIAEEQEFQMFYWNYYAPFPLHLTLEKRFERNSVIFLDQGERLTRLKEITNTYLGLLILDAHVYVLDYARDGQGEQLFKGFPTRCPVTKWWVSRYGEILARGMTAASLSAAIAVVLRNHQYNRFGYYV